MFIYMLKSLMLPPGVQLLLLLLAFLIRRRFRWLSRFLTLSAIISLWWLSTPAANHYLYRHLTSPYVAQTPALKPEGVDGIVVLGAGRRPAANEYNGDTLSGAGLERLRYAGYLAKKWRLPVIVSGGSVYGEVLSEAALGARFLRDELGVDKVLEEGRSRNTWENAQYTRELLDKIGIKKVVLVTHGYHLRRSVYSFSQADVDHIPYPTGQLGEAILREWWRNWFPQAASLYASRLALHEYLGLLAYRFKR